VSEVVVAATCQRNAGGNKQLQDQANLQKN